MSLCGVKAVRCPQKSYTETRDLQIEKGVRQNECDLQEVAITHLSCLKLLNASCRRVVFTPFFFFVDLVFAASLRLQRNIKLYMLDVLTLLFTVNGLVRTCRSTRQKHARSKKNAVNFYLISKILHLVVWLMVNHEHFSKIIYWTKVNDIAS